MFSAELRINGVMVGVLHGFQDKSDGKGRCRYGWCHVERREGDDKFRESSGTTWHKSADGLNVLVAKILKKAGETANPERTRNG